MHRISRTATATMICIAVCGVLAVAGPTQVFAQKKTSKQEKEAAEKAALDKAIADRLAQEEKAAQDAKDNPPLDAKDPRVRKICKTAPAYDQGGELNGLWVRVKETVEYSKHSRKLLGKSTPQFTNQFEEMMLKKPTQTFALNTGRILKLDLANVKSEDSGDDYGNYSRRIFVPTQDETVKGIGIFLSSKSREKLIAPREFTTSAQIKSFVEDTLGLELVSTIVDECPPVKGAKKQKVTPAAPAGTEKPVLHDSGMSGA